MKITSANIYYNEHQTPASKDFDDVYFSNENGVQETDYVFVEGNRLWQQWLQHDDSYFCIVETGFGTGLNFFRTLQWFYLFKYHHPKHVLSKLHFISTEKYPLHKNDLKNVFNTWQQNAFFSPITIPAAKGVNNAETPNIQKTNENAPIDFLNNELFAATETWIKQYPIAVEGVHRRHFSPSNKSASIIASISLDLHYADAIYSFEQIKTNDSGIAHAWFLDGFAPSKNSSMWQDNLFTQMARLSKSNASFATFTAAGLVKRGLQKAGFDVEKRKGFGRKREMLVGRYKNIPADAALDKHNHSSKDPSVSTKASAQRFNYAKLPATQAPYFARPSLSQNTCELDNTLAISTQYNTTIKQSSLKNEVTIVGNGLAGAITALKLVQQNIPVSLLWQGEHPADGASGNPIGGFYPQLNVRNDEACQIQLHSFLYACDFYQTLHKQHPFEHDWCGALQLGFNTSTQARLSKLVDKALWPNEVAHLVSSQEASSIANIDIPYQSLYLPKAGVISVPSLVNACIKQAEKSGLLTLRPYITLLQYEAVNHDIKLTIKSSNSHVAASQCIHTPALVIAMGDGAKPLIESVVPLRLTRGQVEIVKSEGTLSHLQTLLCHIGYLTPALKGFHALGSTYIKGDVSRDIRQQETQDNFDKHSQSMQAASWLDEISVSRSQTGNKARAAIRCSSPDHLPVVGALPSELQFTELSDLYKALPLQHYVSGSHQKNVFVLSALGSRGLTTAPLMAELLVSQMLGRPLPLPAQLLNALNPNRFIVRALIRRQPLSVKR